MYNIMFSVATLQRIYDLGAGLNMYKVSMLRDKHYIKFADNLTFNYYGVLALRYYHQTYKFFPLVWSEDDQVSNVKMVNQAVNVLKLLGSFVINRKKFIISEHRDKVIAEYTAQVIWQNE